MISGSDPCRRIGIAWFGVASPLLFMAACSLPATTAKGPQPLAPGHGASQTGIASWYGPGFQGRTTASGAIYDQHELTAAHQTLPLGTRIMVSNLSNGKSTEVTINDRGPFAKGRILDLSHAAAKTLGMIGPGTIPVRLEVIDSGPVKISTIPKSLDYTLQLGAFTELGNALRLKEELARTYPELSQPSVVSFQGRGAVYYRVQVGIFSNHHEAEKHARRLEQLGLPVIIREK